MSAKCHLCGEVGHVRFDCTKNVQIKNIDVILRYCRDFRTAHISFGNGKKGFIECTYEKKKGTVHTDTRMFSDIRFKSVKYFWKNVTKCGIPTQIDFVLHYHTMIQMLSEKNIVKYTFVAEDKRSGCNLMKILEIRGMPVNHNAHRDCMRSVEQKEFYSKIVALYKDEILAPRNCRKQILFILWINKNRFWPFIPKDIILLILKRVWRTRYYCLWRREFDIKKCTTLKVL